VLTVEQLSKPAVLDSDSDDEPPKDPTDPKEMEALSRRMEAQKLEADRTGDSSVGPVRRPSRLLVAMRRICRTSISEVPSPTTTRDFHRP
jgi:hypothetical protein